MKVKYKDVVCKYCGSHRVGSYGSYRGVPRWWCKDCKRKFVDNDALPKMQTPIVQIASALSMFYEGMSLNDIRRHLNKYYKNYPSDSSVYYWITRFTKVAIKASEGYKAQVGDTWIADEMVLKIEGINTWFRDVMDAKTRFLLASRMSLTHTIPSVRVLMEQASKRADKIPRLIITNKLKAYIDGIELSSGTDTEHITLKKLTARPGTQLIERLHRSINGRTKVMRGLKKQETAKLIMAGWLVHYNFFRPHESLNGITPAKKAGIEFPFKNWADIVRGSRRIGEN